MTRLRMAWGNLDRFGRELVLVFGVVVASAASGLVADAMRTAAPRSATPAPIVQPVPLSALLDTIGREEVRDVAATPIGGAQAEWERYVRSSAASLPLAPNAGSSTAVEASGLTPPGASATAFESTRDVAVEEVEPVPAALAGASSTAATLTEAEVYAAALAASGSERWAREATVIAWCESRYRTDVVGPAGERGAWQVMPRFHGPVPGDLAGQVAQVREIWLGSGWSLWTCSMGATR